MAPQRCLRHTRALKPCLVKLLLCGGPFNSAALRFRCMRRPATILRFIWPSPKLPKDLCWWYRLAGERRKGFWGELMTEAAVARGISGLVTDGAVRDIKAIRDLGFPVFSAGIAVPGTAKLQEGTRNSQIELSGVSVAPGDIVFGDDDGVVLVPKDLLEAVGQSAERRMRKEAEFIRQLSQGALTVDLLGLSLCATRTNISQTLDEEGI
jgi:hypothetical protein